MLPVASRFRTPWAAASAGLPPPTMRYRYLAIIGPPESRAAATTAAPQENCTPDRRAATAVRCPVGLLDGGGTAVFLMGASLDDPRAAHGERLSSRMFHGSTRAISSSPTW